MERILNIIKLDIKRKGGLRSLVTFLIILTFTLYLVTIKGEISSIPSKLLLIIPYIILAISSFSLTQEFTNKTDKIIFSGIFSRNEIIISKLMSFLFTSIICFVFYEIALILCNTFEAKLFFNSLYVFLVYTFTLGSFVLLISAITSNFIATGIIGYMLYFDLTLSLLNQALLSNRSEILKHTIVKLPFYIANNGFYIGNYTLNQSIIMITWGVLFLVMSFVIINKKDM